MKKLVILLSVFSIILFAGCEKNPFNPEPDPLDDPNSLEYWENFVNENIDIDVYFQIDDWNNKWRRVSEGLDTTIFSSTKINLNFKFSLKVKEDFPGNCKRMKFTLAFIKNHDDDSSGRLLWEYVLLEKGNQVQSGEGYLQPYYSADYDLYLHYDCNWNKFNKKLASFHVRYVLY